jgi:Methyltransferase domain
MPIPMPLSWRELSQRFRRKTARLTPAAQDGDLTSFVCNLCNASNGVLPSQLARETPSCGSCGSTVRFRSIAHLLVRELLGEDRALPDLPQSPHIVGIGLSDALSYALPLTRRFSYTNTFFDTEPKLDITAVPSSLAGRHDFVIASDVFEHVVPPVSRAFAGARQLLKPDGVLILTVPFSLDADTVEHFPDLHDFRIVEAVEGTRRLQNRTREGSEQAFDGLVFHGGDGATLEMRLFSRAALLRELRDAGFSRVRLADEACPRFGIVWRHPWSVPLVARP